MVKKKLAKCSPLTITDKFGNLKARIENYNVSVADECNTIRTVDCEMLLPVENIRCESCKNNIKVLFAMRQLADDSKFSSKTPNVTLYFVKC